MNETKTRLAGVDVCKCIAIALVLLIHASADVLRDCAPGSGSFLEALLWSAPAGGGGVFALHARTAAGVGREGGERRVAGIVLRVSCAYPRAADALSRGADHGHLPAAAVRAAARRAVRRGELDRMARAVAHPPGAQMAHIEAAQKIPARQRRRIPDSAARPHTARSDRLTASSI